METWKYIIVFARLQGKAQHLTVSELESFQDDEAKIGVVRKSPARRPPSPCG
jgi:hypothetical protein